MTDVQATGGRNSPRLAEGRDFGSIQTERREETLVASAVVTGAALPRHRSDQHGIISARSKNLVLDAARRGRGQQRGDP